MSKLNANSVELGSLTTTARDALTGVSAGTIIYNSTNKRVEMYDGTAWAITDGSLAATGGTEDTTSRSGYKIHTFTTPGTFTVTQGSGPVEYLIIAGGGGGGGERTGGGGGAGGYRAGNVNMSPGSYPIAIGGGGAENTAGSDTTFHVITSTGGGQGAIGPSNSPSGTGFPGGSGGGSRSNSGSATGGTGISGQGNPGGPTGPLSGGGGGGAGGAGGQGKPSGPGAGGNGLASSINGSSVTRGGGGGGGATSPQPTGGAGGPGGGGAGANPSPGVGSPGTANTGGGGGGSGPGSQGGGSGGSGIVIIAYETS